MTFSTAQHEMTKVFLVCSGLGHIGRGYESFTQECYEALSGANDLEITLFKGGGGTRSGRLLPCLQRHARFTKLVARLLRCDAYLLEQLTFALLLIPYICVANPDVIYFSDEHVGVYLFRWRRISKQRFRLLFSNGAPLGPPYPRWDHVQQIAPGYYEAALASGEPEQKQSLISYGFQISERMEQLSLEEIQEQREALGLPTERLILLSVGALNKYHKRIDYLIKEVASLPNPRPFLVLLGQREEESEEIERLAASCLGEGNYTLRSAPHEQIYGYYRIADLFVLASQREGFGRVLVEAMSFGLPCLVHDYAVTRYVLSDFGFFGDFENAGGLSLPLSHLLAHREDVDKVAIHRFAYERYSWSKIKWRYIAMLHRCANGTPSDVVS